MSSKTVVRASEVHAGQTLHVEGFSSGFKVVKIEVAITLRPTDSLGAGSVTLHYPLDEPLTVTDP